MSALCSAACRQTNPDLAEPLALTGTPHYREHIYDWGILAWFHRLAFIYVEQDMRGNIEGWQLSDVCLLFLCNTLILFNKYALKEWLYQLNQLVASEARQAAKWQVCGCDGGELSRSS